ncbi:MAG: type I methionyl aminopeptidase [bacterium]
MIRVKTPDQIEELARAGALVMECHALAREMVRPGITTREIDAAIEKHVLNVGAKPAWKGIQGPSGAGPFPSITCMSPDEQVVHGFPNDEPLKAGQILSVDIGVRTKSGWYGDAARTYIVGGDTDIRKLELVAATRASLEEAVKVMRPGNFLGDIGHAVQSYVEERGFSVVRELVGHGIGQELWEQPQVPNYGKAGRGLKLREGMVLCVEPMVNVGTFEVKVLSDGWTIVTADNQPSAHFEHMIAILAGGPRVLTPDVN